MKNIRITLGVAAFALASVGAVSFTSKGETKTKNGEPVLVWLDAGFNEIGRQTKTEQQAECGNPEQFCANGYQIDPITGDPIGAPVDDTEKPL